MRVMSPGVHRPASTPCLSLARGTQLCCGTGPDTGGVIVEVDRGTESKPCKLVFSVRVFTDRLTPFKRLIRVC